MVFPHNFWGDDLDTFGSLRESNHRRGEFLLFYSYHTVSGAPVLVALVAGDAAQRFEHTSPTESLHRVLTILRESLGNRLFFGGEATTRQYPATMHGAYLSGLREASRILRASRAWQNNPRKFIPKSVGQSIDILLDLFEKPDLVFEDFHFVFNPLTEDPNSLGLMQLTLDKCCNEFGSYGKQEDSSHYSLDQDLQLYMVNRKYTWAVMHRLHHFNATKIAVLCSSFSRHVCSVDCINCEEGL